MIESMRMRNVFACLSGLFVAMALSLAAPMAYAGMLPEKLPLAAPLTPVHTGAGVSKQSAQEKPVSAAQINMLWSQSGSATVDLLMQWANKAMLEHRYPSAIDFLNEAIALDPDYAEAWNRRATVYFLQKDYAYAMYDINRTLELEPRHYGALTGMAAILRARGLKEQAMKAYEQALSIYPMMRDAQKNFNDLADELTDTRT